jgi:hypothetical protein
MLPHTPLMPSIQLSDAFHPTALPLCGACLTVCLWSDQQDAVVGNGGGRRGGGVGCPKLR